MAACARIIAADQKTPAEETVPFPLMDARIRLPPGWNSPTPALTDTFSECAHVRSKSYSFPSALLPARFPGAGAPTPGTPLAVCRR